MDFEITLIHRDEINVAYQFTNRLPRNQEIKTALAFDPKILESKTILERISEKIKGFIETYIEGMGGSR